MYGRDERDLVASLDYMSRLARQRSNFNQAEAQGIMRDWIAQDRRFDQFDRDRLVARVSECQGSGAAISLDDPFLRQGGQRRPLDPSR